jgi:hypothetical protein
MSEQHAGGGIFGTANRTVTALSGSPVLLVLVLLNLGFLGAAAYYFSREQEGDFMLLKQVFDRCLPDVKK